MTGQNWVLRSITFDWSPAGCSTIHHLGSVIHPFFYPVNPVYTSKQWIASFSWRIVWETETSFLQTTGTSISLLIFKLLSDLIFQQSVSNCSAVLTFDVMLLFQPQASETLVMLPQGCHVCSVEKWQASARHPVEAKISEARWQRCGVSPCLAPTS